jgi:spermidine synthase
MSPDSEVSTAGAGQRFSPVLLLLFVGSGCAALVYELIWFQLLREVIGSSAVSLALVLTSFMGGMCAGSLALPRWVSPARHPLRVYAWLELGIGVLGIALLGLLPLVGRLYLAIVGYGHAGLALRAALCLICLLPPTMLMGATLPALSRWLETTRTGVARLGLLYMANIAGGVVGCLRGLVGADGPGRRSRLDAPARADLRWNRVQLHHHPGGLPGGPRHRQ